MIKRLRSFRSKQSSSSTSKDTTPPATILSPDSPSTSSNSITSTPILIHPQHCARPQNGNPPPPKSTTPYAHINSTLSRFLQSLPSIYTRRPEQPNEHSENSISLAGTITAAIGACIALLSFIAWLRARGSDGCDRAVVLFLKRVKLKQYSGRLCELGYTTLQDILHLSDDDLMVDVGIERRAHRNRILYTAAMVTRQQALHSLLLLLFCLLVVMLGIGFCVWVVRNDSTRNKITTFGAVIASEMWYSWRMRQRRLESTLATTQAATLSRPPLSMIDTTRQPVTASTKAVTPDSFNTDADNVATYTMMNPTYANTTCPTSLASTSNSHSSGPPRSKVVQPTVFEGSSWHFPGWLHGETATPKPKPRSPRALAENCSVGLSNTASLLRISDKMSHCSECLMSPTTTDGVVQPKTPSVCADRLIGSNLDKDRHFQHLCPLSQPPYSYPESCITDRTVPLSHKDQSGSTSCCPSIQVQASGKSVGTHQLRAPRVNRRQTVDPVIAQESVESIRGGGKTTGLGVTEPAVKQSRISELIMMEVVDREMPSRLAFIRMYLKGRCRKCMDRRRQAAYDRRRRD